MKAYTATAERGRRTWVVQGDQVAGALSEVSRLEQAESAIREAIAFVEDIPEDAVHVTVRPVLPVSIEEQLAETQRLRNDATLAAEAASESMRTTARALRRAGWSLRDIGTALKVSYQRAHQLLSQ